MTSHFRQHIAPSDPRIYLPSILRAASVSKLSQHAVPSAFGGTACEVAPLLWYCDTTWDLRTDCAMGSEGAELPIVLSSRTRRPWRC